MLWIFNACFAMVYGVKDKQSATVLSNELKRKCAYILGKMFFFYMNFVLSVFIVKRKKLIIT